MENEQQHNSKKSKKDYPFAWQAGVSTVVFVDRARATRLRSIGEAVWHRSGDDNQPTDE